MSDSEEYKCRFKCAIIGYIVLLVLFSAMAVICLAIPSTLSNTFYISQKVFIIIGRIIFNIIVPTILISMIILLLKHKNWYIKELTKKRNI